MPVGGHSPLPLFPGRGGAGACFPRPPPKRFLAAPAQPQSLAAAAGLLHSLLHPSGLKGRRRRREGRGEGRDWGRRVREGVKDLKTGRPGHDVTSGRFGRGGPMCLGPRPNLVLGGGVTSQGRGRSASWWRFFRPRGSVTLAARAGFPGPTELAGFCEP